MIHLVQVVCEGIRLMVAFVSWKSSFLVTELTRQTISQRELFCLISFCEVSFASFHFLHPAFFILERNVTVLYTRESLFGNFSYFVPQATTKFLSFISQRRENVKKNLLKKKKPNWKVFDFNLLFQTHFEVLSLLVFFCVAISIFLLSSPFDYHNLFPIEK